MGSLHCYHIIAGSALTLSPFTTCPTHGSPMCTDMARCAQVPGCGPGHCLISTRPLLSHSQSHRSQQGRSRRLEQQQPLLGGGSRGRGSQGGPGQPRDWERPSQCRYHIQPALGTNYKYHGILTLYSPPHFSSHKYHCGDFRSVWSQFSVWNTRSLGERHWPGPGGHRPQPGQGLAPAPVPAPSLLSAVLAELQCPLRTIAAFLPSLIIHQRKNQ